MSRRGSSSDELAAELPTLTDDDFKADMKKELGNYGRDAKSCDKKMETVLDFDVRPAMYEILNLRVTVQPNSAVSERVFSLLNYYVLERPFSTLSDRTRFTVKVCCSKRRFWYGYN